MRSIQSAGRIPLHMCLVLSHWAKYGRMETRQEKCHGNTAGPFILHSTISKNVLNDFGLVQAKQHDTESLGQRG